MNRNFSTTILLLLLSLFAACSGAGTGANATVSNASPGANSQAASSKGLPEDVLQASAQKVEAQAGKSAQAEVHLKIKEGYHINANPASQYQIATQLTVEKAEGITAGQPVYPPSITKKFAFSEQPLAVYEKEATIGVPLNVEAKAAKGEQTVAARIKFQACDEQVCYPPRNLQLSIPVSVK